MAAVDRRTSYVRRPGIPYPGDVYRASVPPMLPIPMIPVAIGDSSFLFGRWMRQCCGMTPELNR